MNFVDWKFEIMFKIWKGYRLAKFFVAVVVSVTKNDQTSISSFYPMVFIG